MSDQSPSGQPLNDSTSTLMMLPCTARRQRALVESDLVGNPVEKLAVVLGICCNLGGTRLLFPKLCCLIITARVNDTSQRAALPSR